MEEDRRWLASDLEFGGADVIFDLNGGDNSRTSVRDLPCDASLCQRPLVI